MSVATFEGAVTTLPVPSSRFSKFVRREGWTVGVAVLLLVLTVWRFSQLDDVTGFAARTVTAGSMTLAFIAMGQSVIILSGGIDLSVGAKMVLANCLSAMWMEDRGLAVCAAIALGVIVIVTALSAATGLIVTASGVPDIIVTLAAGFTVAGLALFIIGGPGGGTSPDFQKVIAGSFSNPLPSVLWTVGVLVLIAVPLRFTRSGLAIYAVGSDRKAAFLSGVAVARTRVVAYTVGGFLAGCAGIVTTAFTGGGEPRARIANDATLNSVAAAVLGGVALSGGVGGLTGPVLAALCLSLIPAIMLGLGWDPNNAETARGVIIILVVMVAGLLQARRRRA